MENEIALQKRDTGRRYDKKSSPSYGLLDLDIYTVKDIAARLGVNKSVVLGAIHRKKLVASYMGGPAGYRVRHQALLNWLEGLMGDAPEE
jgi:excisionase family DNA binding protein